MINCRCFDDDKKTRRMVCRHKWEILRGGKDDEWKGGCFVSGKSDCSVLMCIIKIAYHWVTRKFLRKIVFHHPNNSHDKSIATLPVVQASNHPPIPPPFHLKRYSKPDNRIAIRTTESFHFPLRPSETFAVIFMYVAALQTSKLNRTQFPLKRQPFELINTKRK